jgi:hypothetical protein
MLENYTRRRLLAGAAVVATGASLGACATNPLPNVNVTTISSLALAGLQAIGTEIVSVAPQLEKFGLSGSSLSTVQTIIADIEQILGGVNAASSAVSGQTVLAQIEGYVNTLAPIILPFVAAVPGGTIIGAIIAALPAIETAVNFLISLLSPQAQQVAATAPTPGASVSARAKVRFGAVAPTPSQVYLEALIAAAASTRVGVAR